MPSPLHEALVALFRNRLELATGLLAELIAIEVPEFDELRVGSTTFEQSATPSYAADHVVKLVRGGKVVAAIVLEVQLRRDKDKRRTWPHYLAALRASLDCPCWLLVVAPWPSVARWCAQPIEVGHPGFSLTPLVLGPSAVPALTSLEQARDGPPEIAVLSAVAHGRGEQGLEVGRTAFDVIKTDGRLDDAQRWIYIDVVLSSLGEAARRALEGLMSTGGHQYLSEFARKYHSQGLAEGVAQGRAEGEAKGMAEGEAKGVAQGKADAILSVLKARGLAVPHEVEARVRACTDLARLDEWIARAAVAPSAEGIFG